MAKILFVPVRPKILKFLENCNFRAQNFQTSGLGANKPSSQFFNTYLKSKKLASSCSQSPSIFTEFDEKNFFFHLPQHTFSSKKSQRNLLLYCKFGELSGRQKFFSSNSAKIEGDLGHEVANFLDFRYVLKNCEEGLLAPRAKYFQN